MEAIRLIPFWFAIVQADGPCSLRQSFNCSSQAFEETTGGNCGERVSTARLSSCDRHTIDAQRVHQEAQGVCTPGCRYVLRGVIRCAVAFKSEMKLQSHPYLEHCRLTVLVLGVGAGQKANQDRF